MLTPRLRRRRHSVDAYIHVELEELVSSTTEASVLLRREIPAATSAVDEESIATTGQGERLSA
jgi:hypothetical protein